MAIWAYPDEYSVLPAGPLNLHVCLTAESDPATAAAQQLVGVRVYALTQYRYIEATPQPPPWDDPMAFKAMLAPQTVPTHDAARPANPGQDGVEDWNWPDVLTVDTSALVPGVYIAEVGTYASAGAAQPSGFAWVEFVVLRPESSAPAQILYKVNINTIQAYNPCMGDEDAYSHDMYVNLKEVVDVDGVTRYKLTLRRPVATVAWLEKSVAYDFPQIMWLERQGYTVDFCTDVDVHRDSNLTMLSRYPVVLSIGHDEYWSAGMRDNLTAYRNNGGNLVFLSGNTLCWQIHYTNGETAYTCQKEPYNLDINSPDSWWKNPPKGLTENELVGVGSRGCAIRQSNGQTGPFVQMKPANPGLRIQNADHWIFAGSGLTDGATITLHDVLDPDGAPVVENLIGHEGGGALLDEVHNDDGSYRVKLVDGVSIDGTPPNFVLLGVGETRPFVPAPANDTTTTHWGAFRREDSPGGGGTEETGVNAQGIYACTIGMYSAYGSVFTGSTVNWANVLNEWDADTGYWRDHRQGSNGSSYGTDGAGKPVFGNPYIHAVTRNVIDGFVEPRRDVAVAAVLPDGVLTLILQSPSTGEPSFWRIRNNGRESSGSILYDGTQSPGKRRRIVGASDLTGSGSVDLVLQDQEDGHLDYWTLAYSDTEPNEARRLGRQTVGVLAAQGVDPSQWRVATLLDLHGGATPSHLVLFQQQTNGSLLSWQFDGTTLGAQGPFTGWADPAWRLAAAADLNGDGHDELLFQNRADGSVDCWTMNGSTQTGNVGIGDAPGPEWRLVAACDLSGNGQQALVFQNETTGALFFWSIAPNLTVSATGDVNPGSPSPWYLR